MKKNFTPLLYMIFPILFFIYLILAPNLYDFATWIGIVGAVLFAPLFLIGLVGTLVQLFRKEKPKKAESIETNEENDTAKDE